MIRFGEAATYIRQRRRCTTLLKGILYEQMDPVRYKLYHVDGLHARNLIDTYCANKPGMIFLEEAIKHPMEKFHYYFMFVKIKGGILIDIAAGPVFFHLYTASKYFGEIILLRFNDHCIIELKKWLHDHTGAFDWRHVATFAAEKEGNSSPEEEKDKRLKAVIKHVLKCYIDKENITEPFQLPLADCLFIGMALDLISKNKDDFICNLKKCTKLLNPGGHLLFFGTLGATYFTTDGQKFHILEYNEEFLRKALLGEGYVINYWDVQLRKTESDLTDFKACVFVAAQKNR